jgi:type IV pilus assembly protein PilM
MAKSIGLDIGSQNIRVVELEKGKNIFIVNTYGSIRSPISSPIYSNDEEKKLLVSAIKRLLKEVKVSSKKASLSLSETQAFTQIVETPLLSEKELKSSMQWQAEQYIPLPLEDVSFDFQIVSEDKKASKMRVLISAAPLTVVEKFRDLADSSELYISSLETQLLSIVRSLSRFVPDSATATIINLGYLSTDFAFVTKNTILFTRTISTGGKALVRAIAQELNFNEEQAERYKVTYGIDPSQLEGKVYSAVKPLLDRFLKELNQGFVYFKEQFPQRKIDLILICGGGAKMPGIVQFMTNNFGIETQRAEPFSGLKFKKGINSPPNGSTEFTVATGLAMR